jgi:hypothetical protein
MFHLACTRFNNETYRENWNYRIQHGHPVLYGSSLKIRDIYPIGGFLFVVEMNNEKNEIEGIGLIENKIVTDKYYRIYANSQYNKYIYKGTKWLPRECFDDDLIQLLTQVLFRGKTHFKRRIGITILTNKSFIRWNGQLTEVLSRVKRKMEGGDVDGIVVKDTRCSQWKNNKNVLHSQCLVKQTAAKQTQTKEQSTAAMSI